MTNQDLTAAVFIIDRSGSTQRISSDIQGGVNQFVKDQAAEPGKCLIKLTQFDNEYDVVTPTTDANDIADYVHVARGSTALLDAIGRTVVEFGEELAAMPENERPGKVIVVVATDGLENASQEWTRDKIFSLIKQQETDYNWQFVFLAANQDAIAVGNTYGFRADNSMTYAPTAKGTTNTYASLSTTVSNYRSGLASATTFNDEDRQGAIEE